MMSRRRQTALSWSAAAAAKLRVIVTLLALVHINGGQTYMRDPSSHVLHGWLRGISGRASLDSPRSDGADSFSGISSTSPTAHKRSMSWLLAAVMSVCEEDPRKCRVVGRGRQRVRGPDGQFVIVNTKTGEILDNVQVLKRSAEDRHLGLETVPVFNDRLTANCWTGNC